MRIILLPLALVLAMQPAWALDTDSDGYRLIGSAQDWRDFAALVQTTPNINARMTQDVNLGSDQTMVGTFAHRFGGIFDGQGHTLTVNYNTQSMTIEPGQDYLGAAPFRDIEGATIRNLHTAGTITTDKIGITGLVGWTYGKNTIERCWSAVNLVSTTSGADTFAGFVFRQDGTALTINDCCYSGKIQSVAKRAHAGFVGHHTTGSCTVTNSLLMLADGTDTPNSDTYTFVRTLWGGLTTTITNCYYLTTFGMAQGTPVTASQLADGSVTQLLQANRSDEVWVQDAATGVPQLKVFVGGSETTAANEFVCQLNSGATVAWLLAEQPEVKLIEGKFHISSTRETIVYAAEDVRMFRLNRNEAVAVEAVHADKTATAATVDRSTPGLLVISGCQAGEAVALYATDGRQVVRRNADQDGRLTIQTAALPAGVYIVKSQSVNLKFAKK